MDSAISKASSKSKSFIKSKLLSSQTARKLTAKALGKIAMTGQLSDHCLDEGFLPVPVHFYSPIPDILDLENRNVWEMKSSLAGIDFRTDFQLELLSALGRKFGKECDWPLDSSKDSTDYYVNNPSFSFGCAASTHCMIRNFAPNMVTEIGSGMSSLVISKALETNKRLTGKAADYKIVDPYPNKFIEQGLADSVSLNKMRVESLQPEYFDQLKENDILFIDSGHSVRIGGDVNFLYLEVLPRLAPGVIIHIHDISLPYEYPKAYATSETFRQFWTEQYLLQSFLCCNDHFEVLQGLNYLMTDHLDSFRKAFPSFDPEIHRLGSSSFWIRRKPIYKQ